MRGDIARAIEESFPPTFGAIPPQYNATDLLIDKLADFDEEIRALKVRDALREAQIAELRSTLVAKYAALDAKYAALDVKNATAEDRLRIKTLEDVFNAQNTTITVLTKQNTSLAATNVTLNGRITELEALVVHVLQENTTLATRVKELETARK
jgi:uncharacterized coiled-coil protein SlyX